MLSNVMKMFEMKSKIKMGTTNKPYDTNKMMNLDSSNPLKRLL